MRDPSSPVAVIIVNWNGAADTLDVLSQLDEAHGPTLHPVVVDNASTDDSVAVIREARPDLDLIETGANLGFAAANVVGIRYAANHLDFEWLLLINGDVETDRGFLPPLLAACVDPEVGAASPKIYYFDHPDRIWAAGGRIRVRETVTRELGAGQLDGPRYDQPLDVTYLTTCCMLVPRDALEAVGLFDPVYFICVEDADWSRRATRRGYRLRYVPESRLWHKVSKSTGGGYNPIRTYHTGRSNAIFARRHFGVLGLAGFLAANLAGLPLAFLRELPKRNTRAVRAKARGILDGLRVPLPEPPALQGPVFEPSFRRGAEPAG